MLTGHGVSDEQVLIDIRNTEKERDAYILLRDGFAKLAELPENVEDGSARTHSFKSDGYQRSLDECMVFLNDLRDLADSRSIKYE